jgi:membrane protein DedA with SNARE-associated domain
MVAKFVPGFGSIATALAGSLRIKWHKFLLFDAIGATIWAGVHNLVLPVAFYALIFGHIGAVVKRHAIDRRRDDIRRMLT